MRWTHHVAWAVWGFGVAALGAALLGLMCTPR